MAFGIGAAHQTKRLPTEKIIAICRGIRQPVVLLGGKEEAAEGEIVACQAGAHVLNFCGKLTLQESAAVLRQASLVITHDTGMMHLAAAFQRKILSIWGSTVPAFGMFPYFGSGSPSGAGGDGTGSNQVFEVENLPCRPCSKIGFEKCPKGHFRCMKEMDVEKIVAATQS